MSEHYKTDKEVIDDNVEIMTLLIQEFYKKNPSVDRTAGVAHINTLFIATHKDLYFLHQQKKGNRWEE